MERWKMIKDFPDYVVSNQGRIKRVTPACGTKVGQIIKSHIRKHYLRVGLNSSDGQRFKKSVHLLVAEAFIGPQPVGKECNHEDIDTINNWAYNLTWMTRCENMQHAMVHGIHGSAPGEANCKAKLKDGEVWLIRRIAKAKVISNVQIAKMFLVSPTTVGRIINQKLWRHLL